MILFLDFDGVLHPEGEDRTLNGGVNFCFLPRLEREFPRVKILISSSWREQLRHKTFAETVLERHPSPNSWGHTAFGFRPSAAVEEA